MNKIQQDIANVFDAILGPKTGLQASLSGMVAAKLYEARVLAELLLMLSKDGYTFRVKNGTVGLKAAPGPINPSYAHIEVTDARQKHVANIWTDVEFVGISSYRLKGNSAPLTSGEYHELDIVVCAPKASGRPKSDQVYLGVEAKHWGDIPKKLLRELLGVRRELSFVNPPSTMNPIRSTLLRRVRHSNPPSFLIFAFSTHYISGSGPNAEWVVPATEFDLELWNVPV